MSAGRVLIYVQHLLGIGHLMRAAALARAFAAQGFTTDLVSGGVPVSSVAPIGVNLFQLPPVQTENGNFSRLADETGRSIDERFRASRRDRLLNLFRERRPDVLILETFPFGRRQMRFELLPLVDAALAEKPKPILVASIRDIVQAPKPGRAEETVALVERAFDVVLVHGDPALVPFGASFPLVPRIKGKVRYTGYIANPLAPLGETRNAGQDEVIVSAGGGAVGETLFATALAARPRTTFRNATWRLLVGGNLGKRPLSLLHERASAGVIIEPARPDFQQLLTNCRISISQAGYNTVMDVVNAGARAVVVPFVGAGETEQTMRAESLAARGLVQVVEEKMLTPARLGSAVDAAAGMPAPDFAWIDRSGAETSVRVLREILDARNSRWKGRA